MRNINTSQIHQIFHLIFCVNLSKILQNGAFWLVEKCQSSDQIFHQGHPAIKKFSIQNPRVMTFLRSVPDLKLIDYSKSARDLGGSRVTHSGVLTYSHMKDSLIIVLRHPSMCTCIQLPQPNTHEHLHLEPPAQGWNELLYRGFRNFVPQFCI
jgi:hypothetical protein